MKLLTGTLALVEIVCVSCLIGCQSASDPSPSIDVQPARKDFEVTDYLDLGRYGVRNFVLSHSSRQLFVSIGDDKENNLYQWDLASKKLVHTYKLEDGYMVDMVIVSPNDEYVLVGLWPKDGSVCKSFLINARKHSIVRDLKVSPRLFEPTRFSNDSKLIWIFDPMPDESHAIDLDGNVVKGPDPETFRRDENPTVWLVVSTKETIETHGLYLRDDWGVPHRVTDDIWGNEEFALTKDRKFVGAMTGDGNFIAWRVSDAKEVFRRKLALAKHHGCLQYDSKENAFLIVDPASDGTTWVRAVWAPSE